MSADYSIFVFVEVENRVGIITTVVAKIKQRQHFLKFTNYTMQQKVNKETAIFNGLLNLHSSVHKYELTPLEIFHWKLRYECLILWESRRHKSLKHFFPTP